MQVAFSNASMTSGLLFFSHPTVHHSMSNLAEVFSRQGKYEAAEALHRQTLQLREKVLGVEHPETLTSV
jgi:hypothetical protein